MSAGDWMVVCAAVLAAGVPIGFLLTRSLWSAREGRAGPVALLLTLHTGIVAVVGTITAAAAARSWQLVGRGPEEAVEPTLLGLSRIDGDGSLFALLVLFVVFGTVLATTALALAARFVAGNDPSERLVACGILGLEIGVAGYAAARVVMGHHGVGTTLLALQLPVAVAAMVICWPAADDPAPGAAR